MCNKSWFDDIIIFHGVDIDVEKKSKKKELKEGGGKHNYTIICY
jgi:hypothetical protein